MPRWLFVLSVFPGLLPAQTAPPEFDVVSIKPCAAGERPAQMILSPSRISLPCYAVMRLMQNAYEIFAEGKVNPLNPIFPLDPIEGGPPWVNSATYTIDAKPQTPQPVAMMVGPMMRALLEDRFHLKLHRETRQVAAFLMTVAKSGAKLKPSSPDSCRPMDPTDLSQAGPPPPGAKPYCVAARPQKRGSVLIYDFRGMSLDVFAGLLSVGRPVIDQTGLTGTFDIYMEVGDEPALPPPAGVGAAQEPPRQAIIVAMREQLGLRLDPGTGPRDFLVIDYIEKPEGN